MGWKNWGFSLNIDLTTFTTYKILGWKFWGFWGGNFGGFEVEKTGVFNHHLTALKTNRHKGYKKRQKNRYIFIYIIYKKSQVLIFKSFYNLIGLSEKRELRKK